VDEADKWHEHFQDLVDFKKIHNHTLVPHTFPINPALGRWVKRQRYQHKQLQQGKESTMIPERLELLESIGFVWDSHEVSWKEKLEELIKYKEKHGNCDVPYYFPLNPQLATWATRQRRQYTLYNQNKKSSMNPKRIAMLEILGFKWNTRVASKSTTDKVVRDDTATKKEEQQTRTASQAPPPLPPIQQTYTEADEIELSIDAMPPTREEKKSQVPTNGLEKFLSKGLKAVDQVPLFLSDLPIVSPDEGKFSETDGRMFLEVLDDLSSDGGSEYHKPPTKKAHFADLGSDEFGYHEGLLSSVLSDISVNDDDDEEEDADSIEKEFNRPWSETFDADFIRGI